MRRKSAVSMGYMGILSRMLTWYRHAEEFFNGLIYLDSTVNPHHPAKTGEEQQQFHRRPINPA